MGYGKPLGGFMSQAIGTGFEGGLAMRKARLYPPPSPHRRNWWKAL